MLFCAVLKFLDVLHKTCYFYCAGLITDLFQSELVPALLYKKDAILAISQTAQFEIFGLV